MSAESALLAAAPALGARGAAAGLAGWRVREAEALPAGFLGVGLRAAMPQN